MASGQQSGNAAITDGQQIPPTHRMLLENRTKIDESAVHGFAIPKQITTAHNEARSCNICIDNREWLFIRGLLPRAKI
jgi:hypothetical protein